MERWLAIPSCPGYSASSLGRLRREPGVMQMPNGGSRVIGGILNPSYHAAQGRRRVTIYGRTLCVAPLVCEAFHGPKPFPGALCMHLDECATNDVPSNLAWGTYLENAHTPNLEAYRASRIAERHSRCKLSREQVAAIKAAKGRERAPDVAAAFGIARGYVYQIWAGKHRVAA